jgi:P4 family phage/plasmid primase-like protien
MSGPAAAVAARPLSCGFFHRLPHCHNTVVHGGEGEADRHGFSSSLMSSLAAASSSGSPGIGRTIFDLLSAMRVPSGQRDVPYSHTSMGRPAGKFDVREQDEEAFMAAYLAALRAGERMHLTEAHRPLGPVLIDLDFRVPCTSSTPDPPARVYSRAHVDAVLTAYFSQAQLLLGFTRARAFVLEKPRARREKDVIKDGLHVVIPDLVTTPELQRLLRSMVLPLLVGLVEREVGSTNGVEGCVDEAVIESNPWTMLGSCKPGHPPYKVTRILVWSTELTALDPGKEVAVPGAEAEQAHHVRTLSIRRSGTEAEATPLSEAAPGLLEEYARRRRGGADRRNGAATVSVPPTVRMDRNETPDVEVVRAYARLLSERRADQYVTWMNVGWCLRNIDHRLLRSWVDFSRRSTKFREGECEALWHSSGMRPRRGDGFCFRDLRKWVREDDPEGAAELARQELLARTCLACSGTHFDVACVVHCMYGDEFKCTRCTGRSDDMWYQFRDGRWHECPGGSALLLRLSRQVCDEFLRAATHFHALARKASEEERREQDGGHNPRRKEERENADFKDNMERSKQLDKVAINLKNTVFKSKIMIECQQLFYDERFEAVLDTDKNLICFTNCVYDLRNRVARQGVPEDHLSKCTNVPLVPLDRECDAYAGVCGFMEKLFPNEALRRYVLCFMAMCLSGGTDPEHFHIMTGFGSNGKSKFNKLCFLGFGDYACTAPVSLVTQKRAASNSAQPELARLKGRRLVIMEETEDNERFNMAIIKGMTGAALMAPRQLFRANQEFEPQFKMVLMCNILPVVSGMDHGTWRRLRVVPFDSTFCVDPDPDVPSQFEMDIALDEKLMAWREQFMAMLVEDFYPEFETKRLVAPSQVMEATDGYKLKSDVVGRFVRECTTTDPAGEVTLADAYERYKIFVQEECGEARHVKVMAKADFLKIMQQRWGPMLGKNGTGWAAKGFRRD